jgi:hypothetical protein
MAAGVIMASVMVVSVGTGPAVAQPSGAVLNSAGGNVELDGIRIEYADGQIQIVREGSGQLYSPTNSPPSGSMLNMIALAVGNPADGGTILTPPALEDESSLAENVISQAWDSIQTTQTSDSSFSSVLTGTINGQTYVVTVVATYFAPNEYFDLAFSTVVPAGNTQPVRLYLLMDTYLGGRDQGPGFVSAREDCPSNVIVGVRGPDPSSPLVEAIQYVSGAPFAGYASARYSEVVFGRSGYGAGFMSDLPNVIDPNPETDNGIGVNWNFGSTAGTSNTEVRLVFSENLPVNCPTPGPGPDPDPGPDTDGDGLPDTIDPDDDDDGIPDELDDDANGDGIPDRPVQVVAATPRFTG